MWNEMVKDEEIVFDREESAYPGKTHCILCILLAIMHNMLKTGRSDVIFLSCVQNINLNIKNTPLIIENACLH